MSFLYIYPPTAVSVSVPPIGFELDGVPTTVSQDTVTPANSTPLPVIQLDSSGNVATPLTDAELRATPVNVKTTDTGADASIIKIGDGLGGVARFDVNSNLVVYPDLDMGAGAASVDTQRVIIASDQTAIPVTGPLTDAELRATPVDVDTGLVQALTDAQLRATAVAVNDATGNTILNEINTDLGTSVDAAVSNPASSATVIASLKGVNSNLQTVQGQLPSTLGQKASTASLAVALSSEQQTLLSDIESNTNPKIIDSMSQSATTTSATLTAPAGSKGCTIQNSTRASGALRYTKSGGGASATVGFLLEPGQSTSYQDGASSLDVFAVDGTAIDACVIWYV